MVANPAAYKAMADPLRIRMGMMLFDAPSTVKELARALDVPATRLYYHVRILEQHGLIEVCERRMVSGIEERRYRAVDEAWSIPQDISFAELDTRPLLAALFAAVQAEIDVTLDEFGDAPGPADPDGPMPVMNMTELVLTKEELADVQQQLMALTTKYSLAGRAEPPPGSRPYHFLFAGYPRPGASRAS